jgi:hypothetical protein
MSLGELGTHCSLFAWLTPAYFLRLSREVALGWKQIRLWPQTKRERD